MYTYRHDDVHANVVILEEKKTKTKSHPNSKQYRKEYLLYCLLSGKLLLLFWSGLLRARHISLHGVSRYDVRIL